MRMRVIILTLCVCVCSCVCPQFSSTIKRLYRVLNMAIGFLLSLQDFLLTDFSKMASFGSYSLFSSYFLHGGHF